MTRRVAIAMLALLTIATIGAAAERKPPTGKEIAAARRVGTFTVTVETTKGQAILAVDAKAVPLTATNFVKLAQSGFYNGLTFHRVIPRFVAQGGDPAGRGSGGPGYTIKDERTPLKHVTGALAMAKTPAPNSAGSQFYICLEPQPQLDAAGYTVFGKVTKGMDAVKRLVQGDKMTKVTVKPALKP